MSDLITKEKNLFELNVKIEAAELVEAMKKVYQKQANKFTVPGFRKGKAPYAMVVRTYGEGHFYDGAIDLLATDAYRKALDEHKLVPVTRPVMDITEINSATGLGLKFLVTTKPELTLGEYKGLSVEKDSEEVSEEELEAELKQIQNKNSRIISVEDRAAVMGDIANIDFEGFLNDVPFDGGKGENHDLELGSGSFIPGFEDQVVGVKIGENFEVKVRFPEDYMSEELKGQEAVFKCRLNSLKTKELPVLDDDFAKDISEFDTFEEFKLDISKKLSERKAKRVSEKFTDDVINKAVDNASVEIPQTMQEEEMDRIVDQQAQMMKYQGIELNQYLMYIGKTLEEFKKSYAEQALRNIKSRLTLEAVCEKEKLTLSEEDFEKEYARMAEQYKRSVEEIKSIFAPQKEALERDLLMHKTIELIVESAVVVESKK